MTFSPHTQTEACAQADLATVFRRILSERPECHRHFMPWLLRQDIARFLARYEIFQLCLPIPGVVLDIGTYLGQSAFTWFHLSSILEPYNHTRRVVSFDTFTGFPQDGTLCAGEEWKQNLELAAQLHNLNRPLGHLPRLELVRGDITKTLPQFLKLHPELLVSFLYLDADLYGPTKTALTEAFQRMPSGAVVAFDELGHPAFPDETRALFEFSRDRKLRIPLRRSTLDPWISWFTTP